jgi:hypothetical protein
MIFHIFKSQVFIGWRWREAGGINKYWVRCMDGGDGGKKNIKFPISQ